MQKSIPMLKQAASVLPSSDQALVACVIFEVSSPFCLESQQYFEKKMKVKRSNISMNVKQTQKIRNTTHILDKEQGIFPKSHLFMLGTYTRRRCWYKWVLRLGIF